MRPYLDSKLTLAKLGTISEPRWFDHYINEIVSANDFGTDFTDALVELGEMRGESIWKYGEQKKQPEYEWKRGGIIPERVPKKASRIDRFIDWTMEHPALTMAVIIAFAIAAVLLLAFIAAILSG